MSKISWNYLIFSLFILVSSTVGGVAITKKLDDWNAALSYLWFSSPIAISLFLSQCLIFSRAKFRLFYQAIFWGLSNLTIAWMILSLFFPVFLISWVELKYKVIMLIISLITIIANFVRGWHTTFKKWRLTGQALFDNMMKEKKLWVDWDATVIKMRIGNEILILGVPKKFNSAASVIVVALIFLGLILRTTYPVFCVFAWGIPASLILSFFFQMAGYYFAQSSMIKGLEAGRKIRLRSVG